VTLSVPQITAQLEAVLGKRPDSDVIAIRAETNAGWPDILLAKGKQFALRYCESPLAIREALDVPATTEPASKQGTVLLTPLRAPELGEDILARLSGHRIYQPEGWDIARQLFNAREADARLAKYSWMPQLLLDCSSQGGYPAAGNGFLDIESAWREILSRSLKIGEARPDAIELLRWSMQPETILAYQQFPQVARTHLSEWLSASAGAVGRLILVCIESGNPLDAFPLGLVCDVVFSLEAPNSAELGNAAIRLERYLADQHISPEEGRMWAEAATRIATQHDSANLHLYLERADTILADLRITPFAEFSHVLPSGFDARLRRFANTLVQFISQPTVTILQQLEHYGLQTEKHALAKTHATRVERVQMATRLARWLLAGEKFSVGFEQLAHHHATSTAFVDWARFRLRGGDELQEVSSAYTALREAIRVRVDQENQAFAVSLAEWNKHAVPSSGGCIPLEHALSEVVAPLASQASVLLLVADGLSYSIFRELFANPTAIGWQEWIANSESSPYVGIAALPTITEISRTSLLSGRLTAGAAHNEKQAFANHPALLQQSKTNAPPLLFHKADLADASTLSHTVRDAIASPQKVVGIVYNAIDDHLGGSDQVIHHWSINSLQFLAALLHEARQARRILIVTADHGHVLEDGTTLQGTGEGARWRSASGAAAKHEILFEGGRVLTPQNDNRVVCVWSESVRQGSKKNGYHGGVSAQEVVVPMSVFAPIGTDITDWHLAPPVFPEWWAGTVTPAVKPISLAQPVPNPSTKKATVSVTQIPMFDQPDTNALPAETADWISRLLASPTYESQKRLAARVAPQDEHIRTLLESLQSRGGKLLKSVVAQRLSMPELRVSGFVMAARRVLNVDQQPVLMLDETTGIVEFNKELLIAQFRITA